VEATLSSAECVCVFLAKNGIGPSSSLVSGGYSQGLQRELLLPSLWLHCCRPLAACTRGSVYGGAGEGGRERNRE
jgi:hypothetical protein